MASYHLSVKTIKRSAGRSATAAAAYRLASVTECDREGRIYDYTAKRGVEACFIIVPADAPEWAQDRAARWSAAEARQLRSNSVTARERELALLSELSDAARINITRVFAAQLVERYGLAAHMAINAPHLKGDLRNHHAHILTTIRIPSTEGLTDKTRVLDAANTGEPEIDVMGGYWAELQNHALELAGHEGASTIGHWRVQREEALSFGDVLKAEKLECEPELKLGPAANVIERREQLAAEVEGRDYEPQTLRGAQVHSTRQAKVMLMEMRERLELARDTWAEAREEGQGHVCAGLAALRAAAGRQAKELELDEIRRRLAQITARDLGEEYDHAPRQGDRDIRDRLADQLGKAKAEDEKREKHARKIASSSWKKNLSASANSTVIWGGRFKKFSLQLSPVSCGLHENKQALMSHRILEEQDHIAE